VEDPTAPFAIPAHWLLISLATATLAASMDVDVDVDVNVEVDVAPKRGPVMLRLHCVNAFC